MTQPQKLQPWAPITLTDKTDKLWYLEKVKFIKNFIETQYLEEWSFYNTNSDNMIALYWWRGSGKSSIMKTLCEEKYIDSDNKEQPNPHILDTDKFQTVFFEARKYEKDKNLALSLFHFLWKEILGDKREKELTTKDSIIAGVRWLLWGFWFSIWWWISPIWIQFSASEALGRESELLKEAQEKLEKDMIKKESLFNDHKKLENWFNRLLNSRKAKKKLVVFIDDLDRCESENVINLLSAIKLFFTYSKDIIFVVWVDKSAVVKGLKSKYNNDEEKAEEYLEKIFTINFSVKGDVDLSNLIAVNSIWNNDFSIILNDLFKRIDFVNPRHIKKLLNKFDLMYPTIINTLPNKDNIFAILYIYLAYLYEFEYEEFSKIYDKFENWQKFVKLTDDGVLFKQRIWDYKRCFLEEKTEYTIMPKTTSRIFDHKERRHETLDYYWFHKPFIKYLYDNEMDISVEDIIKIKKSIINIW